MSRRKKSKAYHLPEGDYSVDFLRALSIVAHLELVEPEQLTFWFESGKTINQISSLLEQKIIAG